MDFWRRLESSTIPSYALSTKHHFERMASGQYRDKRWRQFREEMTRLFDRQCTICEKYQAEGVVLQVHHKNGYDPHRSIWDYQPDEIEVLCRGCHARKHGKIIPRDGWVCVGDDDLEDLTGECELCGRDLRYEFFVEHDLWSPMTVGAKCCDQITGTRTATERQKYLKKLAEFVSQRNWNPRKGQDSRLYKGISVALEKTDAGYQLLMNKHPGRRTFDNDLMAKKHAFEIIENGRLKEWLKKK